MRGTDDIYEYRGLQKIHIPEAICAKCGRNFVVAPEHRFVDGYGRKYCKWSCYNHRNDGRKSRKKVRAVEKYTIDGKFVCDYPSVKEAASELVCEEKGIRAVCNGGQTQCAGFMWKYKVDECVKS